jgi:hypothetical protein
MINLIFKFVANQLHLLARKLNLTYNEINVIVYFFVVPLSWAVLIDVYFDSNFSTLLFISFILGFRLGCTNFKFYADELFLKSVQFLNYFNRFGSNYYKTSVWICIVVPMLIYIYLFYLIVN